MKYTHKDIRAYMAEEANGTIVEAALIATKNLESAIYKRTSVSPVEAEAIAMLLQCADELREHMANKRVDSSRKLHIREMRPGLKVEIAREIMAKTPARYSYNPKEDIIIDHVGRVSWETDNGRLVLHTKWL